MRELIQSLIQSEDAAKEAAEIKQQHATAKAKSRYFELVKSGSQEKAAVEEVIKCAAVIGKTAHDIKSDIDTLQTARNLVAGIVAKGGSASVESTIGLLFHQLIEPMQRQIQQLQRQRTRLPEILDVAKNLTRSARDASKQLDQMKAAHPELLAHVVVPDSGSSIGNVDPVALIPEFAEWAEAYVELQHVPLKKSEIISKILD